MKNSTPSQVQIDSAAIRMQSALDLLRGLHWATVQAANHSDLDHLHGLFLGSLPELFKKLDDVSEILGNGRAGNFD